MKKIFVFGIISVILLMAVLSGCEKSGQAIKVPVSTSMAEVYTKAEVDALIAKKTTNQDVLNMLGDCQVTVLSQANPTTTSCSIVCANKKCVSGFIEQVRSANGSSSQEQIYPTPCNQNSNVGGFVTKLHCICC
jgi:hypothetical protein